MRREAILAAILAAHVLLVALASLLLAPFGVAARDVVAGGAAMGISFVLVWALGRALLREADRANRGRLFALGALKVLTYLTLLVAAVGRFRIDGVAFGAGITCFVVATIAASIVFRPRALAPS